MAKGKSSSQKKGQKSASKARKDLKKDPRDVPNRTPPDGMSKERYARLVAESQAPYKGLRKFMYATFGASGAIGGFVFLTKVLAGRDIAQSLPNLALQIGVVALMVFLFRWEDREEKSE